jgi:hypothetical protein
MTGNDKRKLKKYLKGSDVVYGDDAQGSDATLYANLLAEMGQGVGKTIAQKQAEDAAKKKADAEKAAQVNPERDAAVADLKQKQKAALNAAADAHTAQLKAATEEDPKGPLHQAAKQAATKAALYAADAQGAADRVAAYGGTPGAGAGEAMVKSGGGMKLPSWILPVGIGVGVLGLGVLVYRLFRKK